MPREGDSRGLRDPRKKGEAMDYRIRLCAYGPFSLFRYEGPSPSHQWHSDIRSLIRSDRRIRRGSHVGTGVRLRIAFLRRRGRCPRDDIA